MTTEEVSSYVKHNTEESHTDLSCNSESPEKNHCPDPCHLGQPHFGHSAFLGSIPTVKYFHLEVEAADGFANHSIVDGPFLEGPRRPPKHA